MAKTIAIGQEEGRGGGRRRTRNGEKRESVSLLNAFSGMLFVALVFGEVVRGDIYMHNPRGSNDRNCERNENRNNGNRLFDSQNNDKGGYACPRAVGGPETTTSRQYFYTGSTVQVEWTMQHGCGTESNTECEVVVQYMCNDNTAGTWGNAELRDGTPTDANDAATDRMNEADAKNPRFGYHETVEYYKACTTRRRNQGLWLADQNIPTTGSAAQTRQNPNAARRGWECPEERDYYPYWHPTPWKDIAILTSRPDRCRLYTANSQNVAPRFECLVPPPAGSPPGTRIPSVHTQQAPCEVDGHLWTQTPAWGVAAPQCLSAPWGRDNHLGNTLGGHMPRYLWTVPSEANGLACVLRLRYNISTAETPWELDASRNKAASPIRQDPYVDIGYGENVSLAVNTNQYGRTFQDRSYVFDVRPRPASIPASAPIHNINVAGKRGNIVQTYPAIEYQFVPQDLAATEGDYLHFQWAGSDYNPDRRPNNGEGGPVDPVGGNNAQRADRSNVVPVLPATPHAHVPTSVQDSAAAGWVSSSSDFELWKRLAYIGQDLASCFSLQQLIDANKDANGNVNQENLETDPRNCMKLNAARTPVYDAGLIQIKKSGTFLYMSSRNNNFSNRSQKGRIVASKTSADNTAVVAAGATLAVVGAMAFGLGGSYFYAKKHPDSKVAAWMAKIPRCRRS
eukprot:TRINITY_DN141_c0_g1_i1.p1 TRINITY_DN141_c0_g1~~TRINITY_DN141_c0_g1_i1.p1  ORF type:complete len:680 (-),score=72.00 TRINITY_DN141_c0_g1_i1:242-2281(-)